MKRIESRSGLVGQGLGAGLLGLAALALGAVSLAPVLCAEDAALPARAVRLSSVDGQVQLLLSKQVLADQAVANMPLFEGTEVVTADDGRAEIQFEDGSVARLSPNSSLVLTILRGQGGTGDAEIALEGGLGYFELQGSGHAGPIRIRFGDSVVTASGFTVLRINLDNPPGELAVFSGNARVERGNVLTLDLHGGESVAMSAADPGRYELAESIEPDSWDAWNSDRDQDLAAEAAVRTGAVNGLEDSGNPAWNDLDANGSWYNVPDQGAIWSPYDAASPDWDPYGNGYWMSTPQFGYDWVSGYGWGYLPFQCGLWNYYSNFGWGWAPGSGGCLPWWRRGHYGGPNIGTGFGGYHPPLLPRRHPFGGRNGVSGGGTPGLIAVNRRPSGGAAALPVRDRTTPVVIAGHTVQAIRPLNPRPQYDRSASGFVTHTASGYTITGQGPRTSSGPGYSGGSGSGGGSGYSGGSGSGGSRTSSSPAPRTYGGGGGQHTSSPVSHSSSGGGYSGGGGGGGFHAGGGGGGGGGSSSSGGGGTHR
ncbi:MAG: FecR family protein [Terracidiphilus sp.]